MNFASIWMEIAKEYHTELNESEDYRQIVYGLVHT